MYFYASMFSFTFDFVHQLQTAETAENTPFLVMENIFQWV
jgi:hypothetical protein